ncbi:MAG TPA: hypothetical protein VFP68_02485, partial [Burkholderiaceae bacterium]|nr:hypothetical protein [Burkholderiaceae bacterium]
DLFPACVVAEASSHRHRTAGATGSSFVIRVASHSTAAEHATSNDQSARSVVTHRMCCASGMSNMGDTLTMLRNRLGWCSSVWQFEHSTVPKPDFSVYSYQFNVAW